MSNLARMGFVPASDARKPEPAKPAPAKAKLERPTDRSASAEPAAGKRHVNVPADPTPRLQGVNSDLAADISGAVTTTDAKARKGKLVDRTSVLATRVQPETRATLSAYASDHGTTVSDLLRELADGLALRIRARQNPPPR
ncbi:MAG: hypothetical protein O9296_01850 [Novosphingobium sp.]|nr:hypothetical protein [Novosphingobium sp.]